MRYLPLLKANGIDVTVITGTPKRKKFTQLDYTADWRTQVDGTLVSNQKINSSNLLQYKLPETNAVARSRILLDKVIEYCDQVDSKPNVIQILSPVPIRAVEKIRKIKSMGVPIVFSYALAHEFSNNLIVNWFQRQKVRSVYKHFDCIIAASTVLKKMVKQIHPGARVEVIPNGVDTNKFSPVRNKEEIGRLRVKLGLPKDSTIICSVGAIHPRKGTDLLVKAWSRLVGEIDDLHLLLIGPRYEQQHQELIAFKKDIESVIERTGRNNNIHFVGQVENVDEYLKASNLFVFPSKKEGMPNAVLEAMATGLPTILTPFIGLSRELGAVGREYLLVERVEDSISTGILTILKDNKKQATLSQHAREWIHSTMDLNISVGRYSSVYNSLAR